MNFEDKIPEPEVRETNTNERRRSYEAPVVETLARAEYMALLGSGSPCASNPPTQDSGPPGDFCNLT
jgi:hypothetical protein